MIPVLFVVLIATLIIGIPVAMSIIFTAVSGSVLFSPFPLMSSMGSILWSASNSYLLITIPLFILIGEILVRTGIAEETYASMDRFFSWIPGGLFNANIATSMFFAATSGSSVATSATVGTVAMPQARKLGYNESLFAGSIASGGTLGIMIPPSIDLIVYGFLTQTSVSKLFVAGILPGFLLALLFILITVVICLMFPNLAGNKERGKHGYLKSLWNLTPITILFLIIVGSIYKGVATPTEAAALGVCGALLIALGRRKLSWDALSNALVGTMRTTGMIVLIIIASYFLNYVLAASGIASELEKWLGNSGLGPYQIIFIIIGLYIILGCFIETLSLIVITVPIVAPIVAAAGFDLVWFGIFVILLIEMALITPPVGLNLYVVQGVRRSGNLTDVMIGVLPYLFVMIVMAGLLIAFPEIVLYLPGRM